MAGFPLLLFQEEGDLFHFTEVESRHGQINLTCASCFSHGVGTFQFEIKYVFPPEINDLACREAFQGEDRGHMVYEKSCLCPRKFLAQSASPLRPPPLADNTSVNTSVAYLWTLNLEQGNMGSLL